MQGRLALAMAPEPKKPDIERITNRYVDAWESFEHERFSAEELENELLRIKDPEDVPDADKINNDLYRISKFGLVDWFGGREYRVAISPEADEGDWRELVENQIEWVRSEIADRVEERVDETEETEQELSDTPEVIEHDEKNYMSAFVGPQSDVEGQARYYQAALSPKTHDGVVLRAYQDVADSAERLADEITDDGKMSETVCVYRFEIDDQEMADVGDNLEYRIYLNESKLL
jgi:hypothetical protein